MLSVPIVPAITPAVADEGRGSSQFKELDPLPLLAGPGFTDVQRDKSGWLLLDTSRRRAYQVFEQWPPATTVVQSFDLDTLAPLRRVVLRGAPVVGGAAEVGTVGATSHSGELVHAVDEGTGRLYLAMYDDGLTSASLAPGAADGKRPLVRFVMLDEAALDRNDAAFAASFKEPAAHAHLHESYLQGMTVTRHHVKPGEPGRLVAAFAHPDSFLQNGTTQLRAHTLVQWDTTSLGGRVAAGQENLDEAQTLPLVDALPGSRVLQPCATASMVSTTAAGEGHLQWGILPTARAIHLGCQTGEGAGAVAEVALGADGSLTPGAIIRTFPLSKRVADVLVDPGGERLLFKVIEPQGNIGATVWVFDTRKGRFTGAIALRQGVGVPDALGLDPVTGRLYVLMPDHAGQDAKGRRFPVRGGLQVADTRLDPVPPLDNVVPDLAYISIWRIVVDPPTRRVFVRRGHPAFGSRTVFPGTQDTEPAPPELHYRVLEDRIPVPEQPTENEEGFTTDVDEAEGLTRASYLGSGSGYGSRLLLVGGADAATSGAAGAASPGCGKDDRELVAGSVGQVSVSDLSTSAAAASLDADVRTRRHLATPVKICGNPSSPADTEELAFDEVGPDVDDDGKPDRTGANHYEATCLGDDGERRPPGFKSGTKTGRDAFSAKVLCTQAHDHAEGEAVGALSAKHVDAFQAAAAEANGSVPSTPVRVGYSHSEVTVHRRANQGIEVRVDSVARDIDLPGVGSIGVVRTVSTSRATGRGGRAAGGFDRTICGVALAGRLEQPGCLSKGQEATFVEALNAALGARGRARLRDPDPKLRAGSASGYRSAVQRASDDLFEDRNISKDNSAAVPGLEITLYQGDGDSRWGTGRQILQLAGGQASASYGITCLHGRVGTRCARAGEDTGIAAGGGGTVYETRTTPGDTVYRTSPAKPPKAEPRWRTIVNAPFRALAEAARLLFNSPRELGLLAAVWALLYAPCYLGERRRSIRGLRARRIAIGGSA